MSGTVVKNPPANAGDARDVGSILGLGRPHGGGNGNPLQYSCLENPHEQRSMESYSLEGHTESDTTERLTPTYLTKYHKLGGLNNRNVSCHSSGG